MATITHEHLNRLNHKEATAKDTGIFTRHQQDKIVDELLLDKNLWDFADIQHDTDSIDLKYHDFDMYRAIALMQFCIHRGFNYRFNCHLTKISVSITNRK